MWTLTNNTTSPFLLDYMAKDNTIGFQTLVDDIKAVSTSRFCYPVNDNSGSLTVVDTHNKHYVQPLFSTIEHFGNSNETFEDARVILISAIGATGKTTLAKELSYTLRCPIVDLGVAEVMGGNSLTGIIYKKLSPTDGAKYVDELKSGKATMIIDGLDEGFQRTKTQGFYDFLDDVIGMTSEKGKSFILLGRANSIELAELHFDSKNIKTITFQIEPFTIEKAEEFIRLIMKEEEGIDVFGKPYKDLLQYIINSIGGFFKDHQDLKSKQYERFIGYAPVLLSIAEFLKKNKSNFQRVLVDFQKDHLIGTSLIVSIVEGILKRDKELKILPQLIENCIKDRTQEFQYQARTKAYDFDEQCVRVLYRCINKEYTYPITGDDAFDHIYNQGIDRWINEHPFLLGNKIANTVFEGYVLARLITNEKYRAGVEEYINKSTGISYMFFSIYQELHKDDEYLDLSIVSYLYTSLKALDNKKKFYTLNFAYDEQDADELSAEYRPCELSFEGNEDSNLETYSFNVLISNKSSLPLHNYVGDVYIDVPINVEILSPRIVFSAPGYINCKNLNMMTDEIVLARKNISDIFTIETESLELLIESTYPTIVKDNDAHNYFNIVCDNLNYPLSDFQSSISQKCAKLTAIQKEYYKKMRRTLIMFRSHSKGEFAKVKSKINNRIASKADGKLVVDALLSAGIIYPKEKMYFINKDKMSEMLGLKFDGLRTCVINDKVTEFLQGL